MSAARISYLLGEDLPSPKEELEQGPPIRINRSGSLEENRSPLASLPLEAKKNRSSSFSGPLFMLREQMDWFFREYDEAQSAPQAPSQISSSCDRVQEASDALSCLATEGEKRLGKRKRVESESKSAPKSVKRPRLGSKACRKVSELKQVTLERNSLQQQQQQQQHPLQRNSEDKDEDYVEEEKEEEDDDEEEEEANYEDEEVVERRKGKGKAKGKDNSAFGLTYSDPTTQDPLQQSIERVCRQVEPNTDSLSKQTKQLLTQLSGGDFSRKTSDLSQEQVDSFASALVYISSVLEPRVQGEQQLRHSLPGPLYLSSQARSHLNNLYSSLYPSALRTHP